MQSLRYLEKVRARTKTGSDYAIAKALGVPDSHVTRYMQGERVMDDYVCARVAELLEIDPMEVIAAANYDRERTEAKKKLWARFLPRGRRDFPPRKARRAPC